MKSSGIILVETIFLFITMVLINYFIIEIARLLSFKSSLNFATNEIAWQISNTKEILIRKGIIRNNEIVEKKYLNKKITQAIKKILNNFTGVAARSYINTFDSNNGIIIKTHACLQVITLSQFSSNDKSYHDRNCLGQFNNTNKTFKYFKMSVSSKRIWSPFFEIIQKGVIQEDGFLPGIDNLNSSNISVLKYIPILNGYVIDIRGIIDKNIKKY